MLPILHLAVQNLAAHERQNANREFRLHRRQIRDGSNPFNMPEARFKEIFRLSTDLAQHLINILRPHVHHPRHRTAISIEHKVLAALRFYATGSYQRCVGQEFSFSVSQSSIHRIVHEVTLCIDNHLSDTYICFPATIAARQEKKVEFLNKYGIGGVIGAIDCTHVAILCPKEEGHNYMNRKGFYSKNVQIICDADLRIVNINARHTGATHDAFIWRHSSIQHFLREKYILGETNSWLLGDSGYPLQPYLLTPVVDAQPNSPEGRYNKAHCSARNCIERCIGLLKTRFRCLLKERSSRYNPEFMGTIINVCSTLHNMCLNAGVAINEELINEDMQARHHIEERQDFLNEGRNTRNGVINLYFNN